MAAILQHPANQRQMNQSKSFRDQYSIRQGRITLYRRTAQGTRHQSDNWYARFKIPGQKAIRKSLKTADKLEAESIAESHYFELVEKSKRGLSLTSKQFSHVARAFLRDYEDNVKREESLPLHEREHKPDLFRNKKRIVQNYLIPFFDGKTLQDITDFDIDRYKDWRRTYWTSGEGAEIEYIEYERNGRKVRRPKRKSEQKEPDYSTINKELTVIRDIFEYARLKRMIEGREIPTIKNVKKPKGKTGKINLPRKS